MYSAFGLISLGVGIYGFAQFFPLTNAIDATIEPWHEFTWSTALSRGTMVSIEVSGSIFSLDVNDDPFGRSVYDPLTSLTSLKKSFTAGRDAEMKVSVTNTGNTNALFRGETKSYHLELIIGMTGILLLGIVLTYSGVRKVQRRIRATV